MSPLTPAQLTVIQALAIGAPVTAAAKLADVSRTTIYSWLEDPHFHQAYAYAHQEYAMTIRDRLHNLAAKALEKLEAILDDPNATPSVVLKAALAILNRTQDQWALPSASFENCSKEIRRANQRVDEAAAAQPAPKPAAEAPAPQPHLTKLNTKTESTPRNAPCPCGSGQKFKRCCGRAAAPAINTRAA